MNVPYGISQTDADIASGQLGANLYKSLLEAQKQRMLLDFVRPEAQANLNKLQLANQYYPQDILSQIALRKAQGGLAGAQSQEAVAQAGLTGANLEMLRRYMGGGAPAAPQGMPAPQAGGPPPLDLGNSSAPSSVQSAGIPSFKLPQDAQDVARLHQLFGNSSQVGGGSGGSEGGGGGDLAAQINKQMSPQDLAGALGEQLGVHVGNYIGSEPFKAYQQYKDVKSASQLMQMNDEIKNMQVNPYAVKMGLELPPEQRIAMIKAKYPLAAEEAAQTQKMTNEAEDAYTAANKIKPLVNQYRELAQSIPANEFNPKVREFYEATDPRMQQLKSLSTNISSQMQHILGLPAGAVRQTELGYLRDVAGNPQSILKATSLYNNKMLDNSLNQIGDYRGKLTSYVGKYGTYKKFNYEPNWDNAQSDMVRVRNTKTGQSGSIPAKRLNDYLSSNEWEKV